MRLVIGLATRGRPGLLLETLAGTIANMVEPETLIIVLVDEDDRATLQALVDRPLGDFVYRNRDRVQLLALPRPLSLGEKYNRMLDVPGDVYLAMVDYAPHVTPGFDAKILEASTGWVDKIGCIYGRMANVSFPEINAATRRWCELVGYFYPEHFPFWFIDHWFDDLATMCGRKAYTNVEIDTSRRPGTQNKRDMAFWCSFFDNTARLREERADYVIGRGEFSMPVWYKQMLVRAFPLTRERSRLVNRIAMRESLDAPQVPDDIRHHTLRHRAVQLLMDHDLSPIDELYALRAA